MSHPLDSTTCAFVTLAHCVITRSTTGPNSFSTVLIVVSKASLPTSRQIIVWHADEKEPRVHIDQVAHRFHMILQISQHVLRVGPHPHGVFLHSRYERSRANCSFVVRCSNKTCSLMLRQRFGDLWTRPWVSPSLSPSLPWPDHPRRTLSCLCALYPVQHSERVSPLQRACP